MKTVSLDEMRGYQNNWGEAFYAAHIQGGVGNSLDLSCVAEVFAAVEGEHDGMQWIAIVRLDGTGWSEGKKSYCVMRAGCDYTGWDCQSGGSIEFYDTLEECLSPLTLKADEAARLEAFPDTINADLLESLEYCSPETVPYHCAVLAEWLSERGDPEAEGWLALSKTQKVPSPSNRWNYGYANDKPDVLPSEWWYVGYESELEFSSRSAALRAAARIFMTLEDKMKNIILKRAT